MKDNEKGLFMIRAEEDKELFPEGSPLIPVEGTLGQAKDRAKEVNKERYGGKMEWFITKPGQEKVIFRP